MSRLHRMLVFLLLSVAFHRVCVLHAQDPPITLTRVAAGLTNATDIQNAGDGSGRLFIVLQAGLIRIVKDNAVLSQPFLDIRSRTAPGGERGLLGLAFPPNYSTKQYFYVNYTNLTGDTVVARYRLSAGPDQADPSSESIVLTVKQPFPNHNGGQLRFGPDGFLYIGMGDGGSGGDPMNNGQNGRALLGKMLRIDTESEPGRYRIPSDNPFVSNSNFLPEVWAYGLRNPWRFSFDAETRDLWIGDVGQNRAEEIDFQPAASKGGENYGWRLMEGLECYTSGCNRTGLTLPILEYTRESGCSVSGGFVYRGSRSPSLRGTYIYGDYCSGNIWGVSREGTAWNNRLLLASRESVSTFGEDESHELYVAGYSSANIYRIDDSAAMVMPPDSVVNAASFVPGLVAGSAATVFVAGLLDSPGVVQAAGIPLPLALSGISVAVNGAATPLYSVANTNGTEQVTFQAPFQLEGSQTASVTVTRDGRTSQPLTVNVLPAQPGIFTDGGSAGIIVHHADNTLVTNDRPLRRGEFAYFYAAGMGSVDNTPAPGTPPANGTLSRVRITPQVLLGGVSCEVLFAGLAPGLVGVYQIDIRVPDSIPSRLAQLEVRQGDSTSPAVTVQVE